jgi:hypothetical protein
MKKYKIKYDGSFRNYDLFENVEVVGELESDEVITNFLGRTLISNNRKPSTFNQNLLISGSLADCYVYIKLKECDFVDF